MSKLWLVARYEYRRLVFTKRFIFTLLSLPLIIALLVGVVALTVGMEQRSDAVGYVDHAGVLSNPIYPPPRGHSPDDLANDRLAPLIAYDSESAARAALDAKEIQAYYVISADYAETRFAELFYHKSPGRNATRQFWDFMQINTLADLPPAVAERAVAGSNLTVFWPETAAGGAREFSARTFLNSFMPMLAGIGFLVLLFMTSGYLMSAVVEEKENRTMEVLVTSISPGQLIGGKVLGIAFVGFTQLGAWVAFAVLAIFFGGHVMGVDAFLNLRLDPGLLGIMFIIAAPAFILYAGLMAALGATVSEVHEAQQFTAIFTLPTMVPLWLAALIIQYPDGPLSIALSMFPLTILPTYSLRLAFSPVPLWQVAVSVAILVVCAVGAVWLAGRAFRLGMLHYGQRLRLRDVIRR
jgi:ABC-2 type transport system permease protein